MARTLRRKSMLSRLFTTYLMLVVVVMFTGIGTSVPVSFAEESRSAESTGAVLPPLDEAAVPEKGTEPEPEIEAEVAAPAEVAPLDEPVEEPVAAKTGTPAPRQSSLTTLNEPLPPVYTPGPGDIDLWGYRYNDSWVKGNLGPNDKYPEGAWVPYRVVVKPQSSAYSVAPVSLEAYHYKANRNAIVFDLTGDYQYYTTPVDPGTGDPVYPVGGTALALAEQDVPQGGAYGGTAEYLKTTVAGGQIAVPANEYLVIYFRAHLAMTAWWSNQSLYLADSGWGLWSGSPGNVRMTGGLGSKTVSIPAVEAPTAAIEVVKFNDKNKNGRQDTGEEPLPGWTINLTDDGSQLPYTFNISLVTDVNGKVTFGNLPAGNYVITESFPLPNGWETSTTQPFTVAAVAGMTASALIGNYQPDVTKTFELTYANAPAGATFFARYWVDGAVQTDVALTPGAGHTFTGSVDLPYGSTITKVDWYATHGGTDILLKSETLSETLDSDLTNRFTYSSSLTGMKFHDLDADGIKHVDEPGLGGWTIRLYNGETLYAQTTTAQDGSFSFTNVLPGSYSISEVLQNDWHQTLAPVNPIVVAHGSAITGLNFGNFYVDSDLSIDKTGPDYAYVGEEITYTITVENTGNHTLYNVKITDPKLGVDVTLPTLAPNVPHVINQPYTVRADDPDPLPNTAYVMAIDVLEGVLNDFDGHIVDILKPAITLDKSVAPGAILLGGSVDYTFVVTNSGEETLTAVVLDDPLLAYTEDIGTLVPGQVVTFTAGPYSPEASVTNTADVEGYDVLETKFEDSDTARVLVYDPAITIDKTGPEFAYVGEEITYTIEVENTGDHALTNVQITDAMLGIDMTLPSLAAGETYKFDVPYIVQADDEDPLPNTAFVLAVHILDGTVGDFDGHIVDILKPAITVLKQADMTGVTPDWDVTYYYLVTNSGEETLTAITVIDDKLGSIGTIDELAPEAWVLLDYTTQLTETTTNIVDVVGNDPLENPVEDSDDETVVVFNPAVSIVKTVEPEVVLPGEEVTYTYVVKNEGDWPLHTLSVDDDVLGPIGTIDSLDPGEEEILTATSVILADTANVGTVEAWYGWIDEDRGMAWDDVLYDSDDAFVRVVNPAISIDKSADASIVLEGEDVTYTFVVENTGDVPLYDVLVEDDHLGTIATIPVLDVGEIQTFTVTTQLTEPTTNVVVASGADEWGHEVEDTDEVFVDIDEFLTFPPDLAVTKVGDRTTADPGQTITYTVVVTNVEPQPATDYTVVDDFDERYLSVVDAAGGTVAGGKITWNFPGPLSLGEEQVIVYKLKVADDMPEGTTVLDNVVVVSHPDDIFPENDRATWRVTVDVGEPFLPFTGGSALGLIALAAAAAVTGLALRRRGRGVA